MYTPQDLTYGIVSGDVLNGPGVRASHPQCMEVRYPHAALCGQKNKRTVFILPYPRTYTGSLGIWKYSLQLVLVRGAQKSGTVDSNYLSGILFCISASPRSSVFIDW